jgi:hypothetical protein
MPRLKPSTEAKGLQGKIAYYYLANRKPPMDWMLVDKQWSWNRNPRVWHINSTYEKKKEHCKSCSCFLELSYMSLCGGLIRPKTWRYTYIDKSDVENARPCKNCLRELSKIANGSID